MIARKCFFSAFCFAFFLSQIFEVVNRFSIMEIFSLFLQTFYSAFCAEFVKFLWNCLAKLPIANFPIDLGVWKFMSRQFVDSITFQSVARQLWQVLVQLITHLLLIDCLGCCENRLSTLRKKERRELPPIHRIIIHFSTRLRSHQDFSSNLTHFFQP